jgi:hypothetical protein
VIITRFFLYDLLSGFDTPITDIGKKIHKAGDVAQWWNVNKNPFHY